MSSFDKWIIAPSGLPVANLGVQRPFIYNIDRWGEVLAAHIRDHPLLPEAMQKKASGPVKISDFASKSEFQRTGIYNEVYKKIDVDTQMICTLEWELRSRIYVVLSRNGKDFSERDRQMLALLTPHLRQAHANCLAADERARFDRAFRDGRRGEEREIIPFDADGVARIVSARSGEWLQRFFSDWSSPGQLPETLRLWMLSCLGSRGETGTRLPLIRERDGVTLSTLIFEHEDGSGFLLLIHRRRKRFEEVARTLPLTDRERQVFRWICQAKSNPEIATLLGLSARTVHKHVERILDKLRVENRLQAMRLGWEMQIS